MKRYLHILAYLAGCHIMVLAAMSIFRLVEFVTLHSMMSDTSGANPLTAFVKGVWFDNVMACYVMIMPLAVLLITASLGFYPKVLRKVAGWWLAFFYTLLLAVWQRPIYLILPIFSRISIPAYSDGLVMWVSLLAC